MVLLYSDYEKKVYLHRTKFIYQSNRSQILLLAPISERRKKVQYWDLFIQFVSNILLNVVIVVPPLLTHHHNCHARVCMNDSSLKPSSSSSKALATSRPVHWAASPDNYSPTSGASFSRSDLDPAELGQGLPTTG